MTLVEQIALQIEQLIEKKHWNIGDKIPAEMELMQMFDVSRNTLREAIRALVHAGLLETKQGSGTIVRATNALGAALKKHIKKASLLETLDVRLALEKQAAQLAASQRTEDDLQQLQNLLEQCRKTALNDDMKAFITADIRFHKAVVQASHNQLLIDIYQPLTEVIYTFVEDLVTMDHAIDDEHNLHVELYDAIAAKDEHKATTYIENYLERLRKQIVDTLED